MRNVELNKKERWQLRCCFCATDEEVRDEDVLDDVANAKTLLDVHHPAAKWRLANFKLNLAVIESGCKICRSTVLTFLPRCKSNHLYFQKADEFGWEIFR